MAELLVQVGALRQHRHVLGRRQVGRVQARKVGDGVGRRVHRHRRTGGARAPVRRRKRGHGQARAGSGGGVAGAVEVLGQVGGDALALGAGKRQQRFGGAQMPLDAPRRGGSLAEHATVDRVAKGVATDQRAVGQQRHAGHSQPLATPGQAIAAAAQGFSVLAEHGGQQRMGEFQPDHAGGFERVAQVTRQAADLAFDDADHGVGQVQARQRGHRVGPGHRIVQRRAATRQVVEHVGQEQRQTVGVGVQRAGQGLVLGARLGSRPPHRLAAQAVAQVGVNLALAEGFEQHLVAQLVQAQLLPQRLHRVLAQHRVGGAEAGHHHPARRAAPAGQKVEQTDRGVVAPVQVFDHQQQRVQRRHGVEQGHKLAQHAVLRGAGQLAPQACLVGLGHQPGQLGEPGRRGLAQCGQPGASRRAARQFGQRVQDRQVGFAAAGLFNALADRHRLPVGACRVGQCADQGALADAGITADQHHLVLAGHGCGAPVLELFDGHVPADQCRAIERGVSKGGRKTGRRGGLGGRQRCTRRRFRRHRPTDEPVAAARHRLDVARLARVVAERAADRVDGGLEHRFADEAAAPDGVEQLLLRDQLVGPRGQVAQHAKGLGGKLDGAWPLCQAGVCGIQPVRAESDRGGGGHRARRAADHLIRVRRSRVVCQPEPFNNTKTRRFLNDSASRPAYSRFCEHDTAQPHWPPEDIGRLAGRALARPAPLSGRPIFRDQVAPQRRPARRPVAWPHRAPGRRAAGRLQRQRRTAAGASGLDRRLPEPRRQPLIPPPAGRSTPPAHP